MINNQMYLTQAIVTISNTVTDWLIGFNNIFASESAAIYWEYTAVPTECRVTLVNSPYEMNISICFKSIMAWHHYSSIVT